jgi:transcriptional regulator with XRE-family HTH domain
MHRQLNGDLLSTLIQEKRKGISIREAAAKAGVGFSTLARLERKAAIKPDLDTLTRIASWLGVSVAVLFAQSQPVQAHLRARKQLSSTTADALRTLILRARKQFEATEPPEQSQEEDEDADEVSEDAQSDRGRWESIAEDIRKALNLGPSERLDPFVISIDRVNRIDASAVRGVEPSVRDHLLGPGSKEWSAATIPLRDANLDWVIVLNDSHTIERRKATLMEEYCHLLLGHDMTTISAQEGVTFRDYKPELESEAYYVGAAILVPADDLRARVAARQNASEIAGHYGVSRELVEFRIKRLGLWYAYRHGLTLKSS